MNKTKVGIIGLGYVGLPLAVAVAEKYSVVGFDVNVERVNDLRNQKDKTGEVSVNQLQAARALSFTTDATELAECNFFIVTVPTPIDKNKRPDLSIVREATITVGQNLSQGDIVVYESTVYPGCTEEICVPLLEKSSGLKFNVDFYCGYSPERINPGDKTRGVTDILKVTSGSNELIAKTIDGFYKSIIPAGTHLASSIRVAEAAKVIENAQRDINIAFVNELALIFNKLGVDTHEVLSAAGTKWNFLPFTPGLVGGHCIGVDPYYLTHKAESVGYIPEVILAGRRINDNMGVYVAQRLVKMISRKQQKLSSVKVLVLGITFKENCPDVRNTRVVDIIHELREYSIDVEVYDPLADPVEVSKEYGISLVDSIETNYSAIVHAVAHAEFSTLNWTGLKSNGALIYDVKGTLSSGIADERL